MKSRYSITDARFRFESWLKQADRLKYNLHHKVSCALRYNKPIRIA